MSREPFAALSRARNRPGAYHNWRNDGNSEETRACSNQRNHRNSKNEIEIAKSAAAAAHGIPDDRCNCDGVGVLLNTPCRVCVGPWSLLLFFPPPPTAVTILYHSMRLGLLRLIVCAARTHTSACACVRRRAGVKIAVRGGGDFVLTRLSSSPADPSRRKSCRRRRWWGRWLVATSKRARARNATCGTTAKHPLEFQL